MDIHWIQRFLLYGLFFLNYSTYGQSEVEVRLVVRKYVEKGTSVTLQCEHNVPPNILYKVTWLKNGSGKFFQFIKNRIPPFRNFTIAGAVIDFKNSNEEQVTLRNIDFDAGGQYYCEVSTDTPIFTKESKEEHIHVLLPQTGPPVIALNRRKYTVGEKLEANCTTSKAHPAPHITWLINGKKVDDKYVHSSNSGRNAHYTKQHQANPSHDKLESNGVGSHSRSSLPSSLTALEKHREEPSDAANGNHLGFEIYKNSGYDNDDNINNGIHRAGKTSDYADEKHFDNRVHRSHRTRKYRRYVNKNSVANSAVSKPSHRVAETFSELNIEISEHHTGGNGKLELTCLATIPSHIGIDEQYADYKTYSVKLVIDPPEMTTIQPAKRGMPAGAASSGHLQQSSFTTALSVSLSTILVILLQLSVHSK